MNSVYKKHIEELEDKLRELVTRISQQNKEISEKNR